MLQKATEQIECTPGVQPEGEQCCLDGDGCVWLGLQRLVIVPLSQVKVRRHARSVLMHEAQIEQSLRFAMSSVGTLDCNKVPGVCPSRIVHTIWVCTVRPYLTILLVQLHMAVYKSSVQVLEGA